MWGKSKKQENVNIGLGKYGLSANKVISFINSVGRAGLIGNFSFQIENVLFEICEGSFSESVTITLINGIDSLTVYDYKAKKYEGKVPDKNCSYWVHTGNWCDKIIKIINDHNNLIDSQKAKQQQEAINRENELKEKFNKLFE